MTGDGCFTARGWWGLEGHMGPVVQLHPHPFPHHLLGASLAHHLTLFDVRLSVMEGCFAAELGVMEGINGSGLFGPCWGGLCQ